jgi:hypothetical protein
MSKLRIFIEGEELDTLESVTIPITKQYEELSDPTVICNDYSKTVTVPLSAHNNAVFGHAYRPDRIISTADDVPLVGVYFDPYQKLTCRVQWGDDVIMQGYAKMLKVTQSGYEVTINGELGKVFQEAQKITFDATKYSGDEKSKYWIDGSLYVDCNLDRALVAESWGSNPLDRSLPLQEKTEDGYKVTDVIGFTPNNAYTDKFNHKAYELNGVETTFESVLDSQGFADSARVTSETAIGEGLRPRDIGEFRAVNQIPHIYWDKFVQIFAKQLYTASGYTLDTSTLAGKPREAALCMRLKQQSQEIANLKENIYRLSAATANYNGESGFAATKGDSFKITTVSESVTIAEGNQFNLKGNGGLFKVTIPTLFRVSGSSVNPSRLHIDNYLKLTVTARKTSGGQITNTIYIVGNESVVEVPEGCQKVVMPDFEASGDYYDANTTVETYFSLIDGLWWFEWSFQFYRSTFPFVTHKSTDTKQTYVTMNAATVDQTLEVIGDKCLHHITLNDLWDNDVQPFDVILRYCKAHRLRFTIDYTAKTIKCAKFVTAASDFTITDMTDRVDSSDFRVEPVSFDSHYILFNNDTAETEIASKYEETYGVKYGEKKITTAYNFDTSEEELFDNSVADIIATPNVNSWTNLFNAKRVLYILPSEYYLDTAKEGGDYVDNFGSFYFVSRAAWDTTSNLRSVIVSDSSFAQEFNQSYYYSQDTDNKAYRTDVTTYLRPDHKAGTQIEMYSKPMKQYTYDSAYFDGTTDIYTTEWQAYINERYNVQNKRVTCKVRLSPLDFMQFEFTQLWKIGGVLYMVNKISDYDVTGDGLTEVELITIQDINGYL